MQRRTILLAAAAVFAGAAFQIRRMGAGKRQTAEEKYPPIGKIIQVQGVDVHYTRQGSGPAIILLHGAGGNLRDFTSGLASAMAKTNEVISFDRPGHGYTDLDNTFGGSPMEQAAFLHAAAVQLGVTQATVLGYSLGGAVALAWALQEPDFVQSLLLVASVSNVWPRELRLLYRSAANPVTGSVVTPVIAAFAPQNLMDTIVREVFFPQIPPDGYNELIGADLSIRAATIRANTRQITGLRKHIVAMAKRYGELTLPVELIHGDADTVVPVHIHSDVMAKTLPHATFTRIAGLGHGAQHFAKDEILAALGRLNALRN